MAEESSATPRLYSSYRGDGPKYQMKPLIGTKEHCRTYSQAPAYSFGLKHLDKENQNPGAYSYDSDITSKGKQTAPYATLKGRTKLKAPYITPGPGAYDSQDVKHGMLSNQANTPHITMGTNAQYERKNFAPPPTRYNIKRDIGEGKSTLRTVPSWSMYPNYEFGGYSYQSRKANVPGPAAYGSTDPAVFKPRTGGQFSMQGRTKQKEYNSALLNPGPGSYDPKVLQKGAKGCKMGIRHSNQTVLCLTDIDVI